MLASGNLVHEDEVQLTTEVIGRVTGLYVEEGDRVSEGQLLLQIDDDSFVVATNELGVAEIDLQSTRECRYRPESPDHPSRLRVRRPDSAQG